MRGFITLVNVWVQLQIFGLDFKGNFCNNSCFRGWTYDLKRRYSSSFCFSIGTEVLFDTLFFLIKMLIYNIMMMIIIINICKRLVDLIELCVTVYLSWTLVLTYADLNFSVRFYTRCWK